jgi:hypothetical protein
MCKLNIVNLLNFEEYLYFKTNESFDPDKQLISSNKTNKSNAKLNLKLSVVNLFCRISKMNTLN